MLKLVKFLMNEIFVSEKVGFYVALGNLFFAFQSLIIVSMHIAWLTFVIRSNST